VVAWPVLQLQALVWLGRWSQHQGAAAVEVVPAKCAAVSHLCLLPCRRLQLRLVSLAGCHPGHTPLHACLVLQLEVGGFETGAPAEAAEGEGASEEQQQQQERREVQQEVQVVALCLLLLLYLLQIQLLYRCWLLALMWVVVLGLARWVSGLVLVLLLQQGQGQGQ